MIKELDKENVPESEIVRIVREVYGVDEVTANFIIGMERGEIEGDVIVVEDDKEEVKRKAAIYDAVILHKRQN